MDNEKTIGKVKFFHARRGYGFITAPTGEDIFVHFSFIKMEGYRTLNKGQDVSYELVQTDRGPQAHDVAPL